jgi:hypothetical protein
MLNAALLDGPAAPSLQLLDRLLFFLLTRSGLRGGSAAIGLRFTAWGGGRFLRRRGSRGFLFAADGSKRQPGGGDKHQ